MADRLSPDSAPQSTERRLGMQWQWLVEQRWKRAGWLLIGFLVLAYIAYAAREIWLPFAIAFMIAMVLDPVVDRLEARGWSRALGAGVIFFAFIAVVSTILVFAVPALIEQGAHLASDFSKYVPDRSPEGIANSLQKYHVNPTAVALAKQAAAQLQATVQRSGSVITDQGIRLISNLIWVVIIPIVAFYALKDFHLILAKTLLLIPKGRREMVQTMVGEVSVIFAKYMRGLMMVAFLNGVATWLLLMVLRVPNAFMLGCVAGVLYSVPYLGAIITIVLVAAVSFMSGGVQLLAWAVATNVILHQIVFDQIISPRILGGHVGLHPILSILALLVGNALLGILGMILAVPVAASIQVAIVALVPKLNQEIDLSAVAATTPTDDPDSTNSLMAKSKEEQVRVDVTEELHRGVTEAVATAEDAIQESNEANAANQEQHRPL